MSTFAQKKKCMPTMKKEEKITCSCPTSNQFYKYWHSVVDVVVVFSHFQKIDWIQCNVNQFELASVRNECTLRSLFSKCFLFASIFKLYNRKTSISQWNYFSVYYLNVENYNCKLLFHPFKYNIYVSFQ